MTFNFIKKFYKCPSGRNSYITSGKQFATATTVGKLYAAAVINVANFGNLFTIIITVGKDLTTVCSCREAVRNISTQ